MVEDINFELLKAVRNQDIPRAKSLLSAGANINTTNTFKHTLLMQAARDGETAVVDFLIQNGADLNSSDYLGNTALKIAIMNEHPDIAEKLRAAGAKE